MPSKLSFSTKLTTPAMASEPYTAEAPPVTTSTRSMRPAGMVPMSTTPELDEAGTRSPSTRIRVRCGPRPRRSRVEKSSPPWLFDVRVLPGTSCGSSLSRVSTVTVPVRSNCSALTVVTGLGASRSGRAMRVPVTTIASSASAAAGASTAAGCWLADGWVSLEGGVVPSGATSCAAAGAAARTPAPRSARACHPAVARKLDFLIVISRIGAPFSATPLVRGRNPPPREFRLASKGASLSSAARGWRSFC